MKGREGKAPPSADLLVCFPSRSHLTLMPKPICSPARSSEPSTRHRRSRSYHQHPHRIREFSNLARCGGGHDSPLVRVKNKHNSPDTSEPTSPKVTCAGQIKIRPKRDSCKNWQSVMEEIERLHVKKKKRPPWIKALGFKKDVMQFLTCLRNIQFDFRCFGSFPTSVITSDDEEDDEHEDVNNRENVGIGSKDENENSETVFSKWFMILQENNQTLIRPEESSKRKFNRPYYDEQLVDDDDDAACGAPPENALLLMRCRSAPAKSWLEEKEEKEKDESEDDHDQEEKENEEKTEETERVIKDFSSKISSDIAKETWVNVISRSRSWKL